MGHAAPFWHRRGRVVLMIENYRSGLIWDIGRGAHTSSRAAPREIPGELAVTGRRCPAFSQPPMSAARRFASAGPHDPGSCSITGVPAATNGSAIAHSDSTASARVKTRVALQRVANQALVAGHFVASLLADSRFHWLRLAFARALHAGAERDEPVGAEAEPQVVAVGMRHAEDRRAANFTTASVAVRARRFPARIRKGTFPPGIDEEPDGRKCLNL